MKSLVSLIIPVYNTEKQLHRCLESVLAQQLQSIEIILVDDGSTDHSGSICDEYAEKDKRVIVVHHTSNRGVAAARNTGLWLASSEYIMFVDSDDWVSADFCSDAYQCALGENVDVVMFRYQRVWNSRALDRINRAFHWTAESGLKSREEAIDLMVHEAGFGSCNKLYRKSLFYGITFPEGRLYEDDGTIYKVIWKAEKIYYLAKTLYYYCSRKGSITTLFSNKARTDWIEIHMQILQDLSAWGYPSKKLELCSMSFAMSYCIIFGATETKGDLPFFVKCFLRRNAIPSEFNMKRKFIFVLIRYFSSVFDFVCILRRRC